LSFVIDASVALRWYIEDERHDNADAVLQRLISKPEIFAVPELFSYETYSILFRLHPRPLQAYEQGILSLLRGGVLRYPMTDEIAHRGARCVALGLTGYDAIYAAVAEELGAVWLTFDSKAHACIRQERISVDLGSALPADW